MVFLLPNHNTVMKQLDGMRMRSFWDHEMSF